MQAPSPASTTSMSRAGLVREDVGSVIGHARVVYASRADWARQSARETATGEQGTNIILASGQARCGCEQKECQP
jgi:hypothetical protein